MCSSDLSPKNNSPRLPPKKKTPKIIQHLKPPNKIKSNSNKTHILQDFLLPKVIHLAQKANNSSHYLLLRPSLTQIEGAGLLGKIIIFYLVRGKKKTIFYFIPAYSSFFISRLNKIFFYNIFNPLFMLCGIHD